MRGKKGGALRGEGKGLRNNPGAVEVLSLLDRCRSHVVVTDYGCWVEGQWHCGSCRWGERERNSEVIMRIRH